MDFNSILFGQTEADENRKRALQEYWRLYQQAYNVKPIPVRTAMGIEYRYPKGAIDRFQTLLPFLQQQLMYGGGGAGAKGAAGGAGGSGGMMGQLFQSMLQGGGKWALNKLGDGKGWGGIFDKLLKYGEKGVGALGDLIGGGSSPISIDPYTGPELDAWGGEGTLPMPSFNDINFNEGFDIGGGAISDLIPEANPDSGAAMMDIVGAPDTSWYDTVDPSLFENAWEGFNPADYADWGW